MRLLPFGNPKPAPAVPQPAPQAAPQDRASPAALEAVRLPPPQFRWKTCLGCGTVQQIILSSKKPSRCTRCGRSPFDV